MALHLATGRRAEESAARFLTDHGLELIAKNFRCKRGELDLVLRDRDVLVVAEVRFRKHHTHGRPAETIDRAKQARIVDATEFFLAAHPQYRDAPVRFDVIGMSPDGIDWIKAAFDADG